MILADGIWYLYRHIRLDKNEPFYIGIGKKRINRRCLSFKSIYERACVRDTGRSKFWNKIANKTDYDIEILLESNSLMFIKEKEIEFIKLYGRRDLKTGILCNLTEGGDGNDFIRSKESIQKGLATKKLTWKMSEETKRKIGEANTGKKRTQAEKEQMSLSRVGRKTSEETRRKQSIINKGKKRSVEIKARFSLAQLPQTKRLLIKDMIEKGYYNKHIIALLNTSIIAINKVMVEYAIPEVKRFIREDGLQYKTLEEAGMSVGSSCASISQAIHRKQKTGGYLWTKFQKVLTSDEIDTIK